MQRVTDPRALRALAHPLRWDLLEAVAIHGSLTATAAAEIVQESPANCSWHLRQLARYGYLEEVPGSTGRQRPWRRTAQGMTWPDADPDPEVRAASAALTGVFIDREVDRIKAARNAPQPPGWQEAAMATQSVVWLTLAEHEALCDQIGSLLAAYADRRGDPLARPSGSRPVRVLALAAPDDRLDQTATQPAT